MYQYAGSRNTQIRVPTYPSIMLYNPLIIIKAVALINLSQKKKKISKLLICNFIILSDKLPTKKNITIRQAKK
jgi:hypothetical protein